MVRLVSGQDAIVSAHPRTHSPIARSAGRRSLSITSILYKSPSPLPLHMHGNVPSERSCPGGVGGRVCALRHAAGSSHTGSYDAPQLYHSHGPRGNGPRRHVDPSGSVPTDTSVALNTCSSPPAPPQRSLLKSSAKGTGWLWKHASVRSASAGQSRY